MLEIVIEKLFCLLLLVTVVDIALRFGGSHGVYKVVYIIYK